jgi:hypothetical protein
MSYCVREAGETGLAGPTWAAQHRGHPRSRHPFTEQWRGEIKRLTAERERLRRILADAGYDHVQQAWRPEGQKQVTHGERQ